MNAEAFAHLACPNPDCTAYGQCGAGHLRLHGWSGRRHRFRNLYCALCGTNFSERTNTPFFGMISDEDTLVAIASHLAEGTGVRATARLCGVSLNTVLRCTKRFGNHAERFHDQYVRHVEPKQAQPDEAWSFVGKKDKHCNELDPADAEQGSWWDHVIIDPETKLIISLVVGKRNADTVVQVFTDFLDRTDGALPELITTDGYAVYLPVILDTYGVWREELELTAEEEKLFDEEQIPPFSFPVEITYATVVKQRQRGRVVAVAEEVVLGSEEQAEKVIDESATAQSINTSYVERWFGTQRQFNARKRRKSYTFSKKLSYHEACTWLVVVWYNFGWCVRTLRQKVQRRPPRYHQRTPAMAAELTDHVWSMEDLLRYPLYPRKDGTTEKKVRTYKEVLDRLKGVYPMATVA